DDPAVPLPGGEQSERRGDQLPDAQGGGGFEALARDREPGPAHELNGLRKPPPPRPGAGVPFALQRRTEIPEEPLIQDENPMTTRIVSRTIPLSLMMILGGALPSPDRWPGLGSAHGQAVSQPKPQAADPKARSEDRSAVRAAMQSFVKAFESRDPKT